MTSHKVCPDCGATIADSSEQCWLCDQRLLAARHMPHSPASSVEGRSARSSPIDWRRTTHIAVMVLAGLLMLPAGVTAFFVVCTSGPTTNDIMHLPTPGTLAAAAISGVATIAVFVGVVIILAYQIRRPMR